MMKAILTAAEARRLRERNGWSLQYLANQSGINKAYLSEFENGQRRLPTDALKRLKELLRQETAGKATPSIVAGADGRSRLIFIDPNTGLEDYRPRTAHLKWIDEDGTAYTMFLGEP